MDLAVIGMDLADIGKPRETIFALEDCFVPVNQQSQYDRSDSAAIRLPFIIVEVVLEVIPFVPSSSLEISGQESLDEAAIHMAGKLLEILHIEEFLGGSELLVAITVSLKEPVSSSDIAFIG